MLSHKLSAEYLDNASGVLLCGSYSTTAWDIAEGSAQSFFCSEAPGRQLDLRAEQISKNVHINL